jgi:hypothetical protein
VTTEKFATLPPPKSYPPIGDRPGSRSALERTAEMMEHIAVHRKSLGDGR